MNKLGIGAEAKALQAKDAKAAADAATAAAADELKAGKSGPVLAVQPEPQLAKASGQ